MATVIGFLVTLALLGAALAAWSGYVAGKAEAAVPAEGRFVEVPGARLHVVEMGEGPPIVMIHGLLGQLRNFSYALAERMARDHRVVIVDRPGWGYSTVAGPRPHIETQAEMIAALIGELGLDRPLVLGHSMGGAVSLALGLAHPERVRGLALLAPYSQPIDRPPAPFRSLAVPMLLRPLIAWTLAVPMGVRTGARRAAEIFAPDPVPADFAIRGGGVLAIRPRSFESAAFEIEVARHDMAWIARHYAELRVPVTILYGRQDALLDPALHGEKTAAAIPGARLTLIDGGHMLQICHVDATEAWLRETADQVGMNPVQIPLAADGRTK